MKKTKLITAREKKGYSQLFMAEVLGIDESGYCRREKGQTKINNDEWKKLAKELGVLVNDIYEPDDSQFFIYNDNSSGDYHGNNNTTIFSIPESLLASQQEYIEKLKEEINILKECLKKYEE
ncbi:MAG: helix-turn-helix domain-containing protein [Bacteroidales bacterium]|jgi:transcriptional regulator with XRE-family HTH domain|nr:helix-turn-helix domain-containing protein [Bacteroidales bacterium]